MTLPLPISVFIIAQNESDRITAAIKSVKNWVEEVIVIDSGSTDNTLQIAKDLGAKTLFNKWEGYGQQKCFGEKQCQNKWILNIDADEEISPTLKNEIISAFAKGLDKDGYRLRFKSMFAGQKKPSFFAHVNNPVRLYNKEKAGFKTSIVHDSVVLTDGTLNPQKIGKFSGVVFHRSFRSFSHMLDKINSYSTMQAKDAIKNKSPNKLKVILRIFFEPPFAFFKSYILRRNIVYGINGFISATLYAYGRLIRQVKIFDRLN